MPTTREDALTASRTPQLYARLAALLVCGALALLGDASHAVELGIVLGLLGLLLLATSTLPATPRILRLTAVVEGTVWALGVLLTGAESSALLPYLMAPAFAGGLALGLDGVLLPVGMAALTSLAAAPVLTEGNRFLDVVAAAVEWVTLALLVGLLGSWINRLQEATEDQGAYLSAFRLLAQLRAVARRLPVGLDRVALADGLLRELQGACPGFVNGGVYVRAQGDRLTLLASSGQERIDWRVDLSVDSPFREAWASQQPLARPGSFTDPVQGSCVVLPLIAGQRTTGLVAIRLDSPHPPDGLRLAALFRMTGEASLRLETALLFDELREVATVEERRRLAREIHDGVAQDLAAFGYELDLLASEARDGTSSEQVADAIREVRKRLGALVGELRNSIFELRTEVDQHGGLGAALTEYVRTVGTSTDLTVHLTLDERPERLAADTEAELLRIAQEAITNARKHARAANLWVRCNVDPPSALLVVEDDGDGLSEGRDGSYGIEIMRERAARLSAVLEIEARAPQGTVVRCQVGPPIG